jgi:molybdopterin synthase catalytic subunit
MRVSIQTVDFDVGSETAALAALAPDVGAVASFIGYCRSEDRRLQALELEHYPGMAEAEIERIVAEAERRWPLKAVRVIHRYGVLPVGAQIVLVLAASSHREAAFSGAHFIMDFLKTDAPFWKREHLTDGTVGPWVEAKSADDEARARWSTQQ